VAEFGFTQPSTVTPLVTARLLAPAVVVTYALVPLNDSALPNLPPVDQVALTRLPVFEWPEPSTVDVPVPSSKPYAATIPGSGPVSTVTLTSFDGPLVFPGTSSAVTL
jgi:hypothetical protein